MEQTERKQQNNGYKGAGAYRAVSFVAMLAMFVASLFIQTSYAWFVVDDTANLQLSTGAVDYEVKWTTEQGLMIPNKELFKSIYLTNRSSIETNIRLQIRYTVWDGNESPNDPPDVVSKAAWYAGNASGSAMDGWYLNTNLIQGDGLTEGFNYLDINGNSTTSAIEENWWYYNATVPAVTANAIKIMEIFDTSPPSFKYDGPKTTNTFAGDSRPDADNSNKYVKIDIIVQGKQARNVDWKDIGTVSLIASGP